MSDDDWDADDGDDEPASRAGPALPPAWLPSRLPVPPTAWPAPRSVLSTFPRKPAGYTRPSEALGRGVEQLARTAFALDAARYRQELSMRRLANDASLPLGSVVSFFGGKVWPHPLTLGRLCAVLGVRWVLTRDPNNQVRVPLVSRARFRLGPDRGALEAAAGTSGEALAAAWHNIAVGHLRWYVAAAGVTGRQLTRTLGVREATWSEAKPVAPKHWSSSRMLVAVGDLIGHHIVVEPRHRAWPWVEWKTTQVG